MSNPEEEEAQPLVAGGEEASAEVRAEPSSPDLSEAPGQPGDPDGEEELPPAAADDTGPNTDADAAPDEPYDGGGDEKQDADLAPDEDYAPDEDAPASTDARPPDSQPEEPPVGVPVGNGAPDARPPPSQPAEPPVMAEDSKEDPEVDPQALADAAPVVSGDPVTLPEEADDSPLLASGGDQEEPADPEPAAPDDGGVYVETHVTLGDDETREAQDTQGTQEREEVVEVPDSPVEEVYGSDAIERPAMHHTQESVGIPEDVERLRQSFGEPPEESIENVADKEEEIIPIKKPSIAQPPPTMIIEGQMDLFHEEMWVPHFFQLLSNREMVYGRTEDDIRNSIDMSENLKLIRNNPTQWTVVAQGVEYAFQCGEDDCREWLDTVADICRVPIDALTIKVDKRDMKSLSMENVHADRSQPAKDATAGTDLAVERPVQKKPVKNNTDSSRNPEEDSGDSGCKCLIL